ncbi:E3 ubiquitin-protein ligase CCNB1IP1 isoform X2 [Saccopteryx bilineata]|uniref:E3 ubiquitin-protein ligase CCNB1IP1 isoform X2 n=1 Tax=Saccopteryx bilineata TaxID=59482 RepID=UPI0033900A5F
MLRATLHMRADVATRRSNPGGAEATSFSRALGLRLESGTALYIMSLCEDMLLCNYRKCRIKLSGYAWVTACSHIFCDQHGSGEFSRSPAICPACNSTLSGKLDIVRTELSPSEEYKAMVLAGLRPEIVLDISSRALAFWTYQVHQERLYQEYKFSKAEGHLKQMEKIHTQQIQSKDVELTSMKGEVNSMKKVLEEYKKKFSDISEKLMERNRQYQKLQGLYDSLRLRNITIANQEGNKSKFPLDSPPVQNRGGGDGDGDFQFRPFFVGSPTAPETSNNFFNFASPSRELEQQQVSSRAFKVKRI